MPPYVSSARVRARRFLRRHDDQRYRLDLEYAPTAELRSRWGHGRPSHSRLEAQIAADDATFRAEAEALATFMDDVGRSPTEGTDSAEPCWRNEWLVGLAPKRYVAVGSGESTKVVARARRGGELTTHITSIDPHPRAEVDVLCDTVVREPLESADLSAAFADVGSGDIVFFDGSHRVLPNSDCVAFFLDVLPELPPDVLVGIHDIYLPDDYPDAFLGAWWSEQYALAALLLARPSWLRVMLPCFSAAGRPEVVAPLEPLWRRPALDGVLRHGTTMWLATTARD